jgi:hypothetical protein
MVSMVGLIVICAAVLLVVAMVAGLAVVLILNVNKSGDRDNLRNE